jgi:hypothetical protein
MGNLAKYSGNLKVIALAGAMALTALNAVAQQEVDPDHFDGNQTVETTQKTHATKAHKQSATASNVNAVSKQPVRVAKASRTSGKPKVVNVAAH